MSFVKADVKVVDAQDSEIQQTMCQAHGCPNRWTINDSKGRLCRWHHHAEPYDWPRITSELRLGKAPSNPITQPQISTLTPERRQAINEFKSFARGDRRMDRSWAYKLKAKEEAGEKLSIAQKQLWRDALRHRDDED